MSSVNSNDARSATQERVRLLFDRFRSEGLDANEACARAIREITKSSNSVQSDASESVSDQSNPVPSTSRPEIPGENNSDSVSSIPKSSIPTSSAQPSQSQLSQSSSGQPETPHNQSLSLPPSDSNLEKPKNQSSPKSSQNEQPTFAKSFAQTDAASFLSYLQDASEDDLVTHIDQIFSYPVNLAFSFHLSQGGEIPMETENEIASHDDIDWEGLKRVYDEIESKGGKIEQALIESVNKSVTKNSQKTTSPSNFQLAMVMTLINQHIASPSYLESAFIGLCRLLAGTSEDEQVKYVKILAGLAGHDLLQMVRNIQQSITIRCLEIEEDVEVHEDEQIGSFVRTLRLLFFAALSVSDEDDWRQNLKKNSEITIEEESVDKMEVDNPASENQDKNPQENNRSNQMTEDEKSLNELLHAKRDARESEDQDPLAKRLKLDWCNLSRPRIPYDEFKNETINNAVDVEKDFVNYKLADYGILPGRDDIFSFMSHPFILGTKQKTIYLFYDSRVKQIQLRNRARFGMVLAGGNDISSIPYCIIKVSRQNLIQDALLHLEMFAADNPLELQKQLVVEFDGEQGVDEGGVSKEFFTLIMQELLKPDYGMFRFNDDTGYHLFNPIQFQETEREYMLIGMLFGLAIYNNINLDIAFPTVIFKKMLGFDGTFEDLEFSHPDIYRSLTQLLEADKDTVESMSLTFSTTLTSMFGENIEYDLVKDGKNRAVTQQNKFYFVEVYADFLLNKSIKNSFNAFRRGFEVVTDNSPLPDLFRPEELEQLVIGQRKYDWETLEEICEYDGDFNKNHETIKHFWSVFKEMDESEKKMLLEFFTGSDRVPVGGLARLKPKIQSSGPDSDRLPTAHTCFNILLLPAYKSREKLKERLTKAIENARGFGMI